VSALTWSWDGVDWGRRCGAIFALLFLLLVGLPLRPAVAQTSNDETAQPPAGWSPEQKRFWVSERKACVELFKDMERRRSMSGNELAKLPKESPSETRARLEQEHGCMSLFPPRRITSSVPPPKTKGKAQATALPTPM
jgi:hypothetical protein